VVDGEGGGGGLWGGGCGGGRARAQGQVARVWRGGGHECVVCSFVLFFFSFLLFVGALVRGRGKVVVCRGWANGGWEAAS
jgi:hypothetical protein